VASVRFTAGYREFVLYYIK